LSVAETEEFGMKQVPARATATSFREPGIWESLRERLFGVRRLLDCLQVEVSSLCPGHCNYCPHTIMHEQWQGRDMDMATFARLWPLMRRSTRVHLQGWGEPLLNPAFFEMAALVRKAGSAASTTTCGLIMNEQLALQLMASGLDIIAFSLAGTDAETNASRRGVAFEQVCDAVSLLQAVRRAHPGVPLKIHFAYLLLASNMEAVRGLPALMQRLGVHVAVISTLDYVPSAELEPEAFGLEETEKLAAAASILKETEAEARCRGTEFHWCLPDPDSSGVSCRENIARSLVVAADGSISPCVYLNLPAAGNSPRRRIFGNVRNEDPMVIWQSEDYRRFRERLARGDPDHSCITCVKRFEK
jgi:MoaA/NifB/PqqE/SkfB family radical SAM enzyme